MKHPRQPEGVFFYFASMKRIILFSLIVAAVGLTVWTVIQLRDRNKNPFPVGQLMPRELDMIVEIRNTEASLEILESLPGWTQTHWKDGYKLFCATLTKLNSPVLANQYFGIKNAGSQWIAVAPIKLKDQNIIGESTEYNGYTIVQNEAHFYVISQEFILLSNALSLVQSALDNENIHPILNGISQDAANDVALSFYTSWENGDQMLLEPQRIGNERILSGVILPSDSSKSRWNQFPIRPYPLEEIELPISSKAFEIRDYNNALELINAIDELRKNSNEEYFWNQSWNVISDSCQCSVYEIATSWQGAQRANFILSTDSSDASVSAYSVSDTTDLQSLFAPVVTPVGNVYLIKYPEVFRRYQDDLFLCNYEYLWYNNSTVYFSDSPVALEKTRLEMAENKTFAYQKFMNRELGGSTLFGGRYITALFPESLTWLFMNSEKGNGSIIRSDESHLLFQWKLVESINIPQTEENPIETSQEILPVEGPEANGASTSWTVINHNTQEKEVLRCEGKQLALLNSKNEVLWMTELDGSILGQVTQVDLYQNGKLQYAFTTAKSLYIIDRNGKNAPNFPMIYSKGITSGLCVADYDNNRNYRLLFGTSDGAIQNISNNGKATPGWQYSGKQPVSSIEIKKNQNLSEIFIRFNDGSEKKLKRNGTSI